VQRPKRGRSTKARGPLDEGAANSGEALRLDPGSAVAHSDPGMVLLTQGHVDAAMARFRGGATRPGDGAAPGERDARATAAAPDRRAPGFALPESFC
jgi:hypothetical protein